MHFVHKIQCFEEFLQKIALFFQKIVFFRFSINQTCFSTDRKCDYNFVLNLTHSIAVGSNESDFQSIESNFRSIENCIESFLKPVFLMCSFIISTCFKLFSLSLRSVKASNQFFVVFLRFFCKVFVFIHR